MPYEFTWYVPSKVVYQRIYGDYGLAEIRDANQQALKYVIKGVPPVHLIADILDMNSFATPVSSLVDMTSVFLHRDFGWLVVVGNQNRIIEAILSVFRTTLHMKVKMVVSLQEAITFLQAQDERLAAHHRE
jgi:hypothetical protein